MSPYGAASCMLFLQTCDCSLLLSLYVLDASLPMKSQANTTYAHCRVGAMYPQQKTTRGLALLPALWNSTAPWGQKENQTWPLGSGLPPLSFVPLNKMHVGSLNLGCLSLPWRTRLGFSSSYMETITQGSWVPRSLCSLVRSAQRMIRQTDR